MRTRILHPLAAVPIPRPNKASAACLEKTARLERTECLDDALFSLSLMGVNFSDYLREAYRTLKLDGSLHIWEASSRFDDPARFARELTNLGFKAFPPEERGSFTYIEDWDDAIVPNLESL